MSDWNEFDRELTDAADALPPPDAETVTPWRHAMGLVLSGLVLTSFTLNFLYLQYILPAVGALNLYLGFRTLRRNNAAFARCRNLALVRLGLLVGGLAVSATPLNQSQVCACLFGLCSVAVTLALFFQFRKALRLAYAALGEAPAADPLRAAIICYSVMAAFLFLPGIGWLGVLPLLVAFVCVCRSLNRVFQNLDALGYAVTAAPARFSERAWRWTFFPGLPALLLALSLLCNHMPLDARPMEPPSAAPALTATRENLSRLGFPEGYLTALPDEEVEKLADARWCSVSLDSRGTSQDIGVEFDTVYVQLEGRVFRVYEFFRLDGGGLRPLLQNGLSLEPDSGSFLRVEDIACRVFWNGDAHGTLELEQTSYEPHVFGPRFAYRQTEEVYTAVFSYPLFSSRRWGYAAYTFQLKPEITFFSSILRYGGQSLQMLFPYAPVTPPYGDLMDRTYTQSYSNCQLPKSD